MSFFTRKLTIKMFKATMCSRLLNIIRNYRLCSISYGNTKPQVITYNRHIIQERRVARKPRFVGLACFWPNYLH